jgi:ribosomal protein L37AE/L43A
MPQLIEAAATGRSKCRGCGEKIAAGTLRFGEVMENPFADGEMTHWFHLECAAYKRPEPFLEMLAARSEPLPEAAGLDAEAKRGVDHPRLPRVKGAERAPSGRAQCRHCKQTIEKGAWRVALDFFEDGRFMPAGTIHVPCAAPYFGTAEVLPRVKRFSAALTEAELLEIQAELATPAA